MKQVHDQIFHRRAAPLLTGNSIKETAPRLITDTAGLKAVVDKASKQPAIPLDLEGNSFHRYPESVSLVQMATRDYVYLIDPLAIEDMSPLGSLLDDPRLVKLLHSADYDVRSLDREWGFRVANLFDTSIAASFIGIEQTGLSNVLKEVLDVDIPKQKKLQRADWTVRPLSDALIEYAASDVLHLVPLYELLTRRLNELGRSSWVQEECDRLAQVRYSKPDLTTAFLSLKGSKDLDSRGLAILKSLTDFRELEARRIGRPHFRVMPDATLVALAQNPRADLKTLSGVGRFARQPLVEGLRQALREGANAPPVRRPAAQAPTHRPSRAERERAKPRLKLLKDWRASHGKRLSLDPPLLWPTVSLERLAREQSTAEEELSSDEVRDWQRHEFSGSLTKTARSLLSSGT